MTISTELEWPDKNPDEVLDYAWDLSGDLQSNETMQRITVRIRPSGDGELYIEGHTPAVYPSGQQAVVWLSGGVPGRMYLIEMMVSTDQDRRFEALVRLKIDATLATYPLPVPVSYGFGSMVVYGGTAHTGVVAITGTGNLESSC